MKKKRFMKRIIWILTSIMILVNLQAISALAEEDEKGNIRYSNGYVQYLVDKNDGRFIIRTDEGVPYRDTDSGKKLLFDKEDDPETSFTTFLIDGKEYIFGNEYGFMNMDSSFIQKPINIGNVNTSAWKINDIEIKQIILLEDDLDHPNVGNVKIRYEIDNKSSKAKKIGSRILLDTMLGDNDGAAFVLGDNLGNTITNESVFSGEEIPSYWRASDDLFAPKVIAYGFTKGWGNPAPNKMIMGHWGNLSETKWSYNVDTSINFTNSNNRHGVADSAVALYWDEKEVKAGEKIVIETYYGLGDLSNYGSNSGYNTKLIAPEKLNVNENKDGYLEEEITIVAEIDNSLPDSELLTNVKAKILTKPGRFELLEGEENEKTISSINKGQIRTVSWKLKPLPQNSYASEPIKVEFLSDNNTEPYSQVTYILIPSIQGTPPEIQILSTSPNRIFYKGDKYFSIQGKGFDYFNDKAFWKMYLVDELGREYFVPKECINVSSDAKINVNLTEEQFKVDLTIGLYSIKIIHDQLENPVIIPNDKKIEVTDDENFRSRNYGILYIEKREKDEEYSYFINTIGSKDELDELKEYVRKNKKAPNGYEEAEETTEKGELVDIIFDIVGDVKEVVDQEAGGSKYIIDTANTEAIINSVIRFSQAEEPIEIKKIEGLFTDSQWITIEGKGILSLINYGRIWKQSFETFIVDGENYVVDEIIEEEEEEEEDDDEDEDEEEKDSYLGDHDEMEINPNEEEEDRTNVVLSLFDPFSIVTAGAALFIDGFELELRDIILLDEGASLGGKLAVELPIGGGDKDSKDSKDPGKEPSEEDVEAEIGEAMRSMFMTKEEKDEEKTKRNSKIRALVINDDEIGPDIISLIKGDVPTSTKIETAIKLIPKSKELIAKIYKVVKGEKDDDDDESKVGIAIDVKKVLFGKKYGEDFIYNDVKYIGLEGEGSVNIELPGFDVGGKEKEQGISAELAVDTIEGVYSLKADVNIKVAEAHAFITIMRFEKDGDYKYLLDDLVLSGGFIPGIPIVPPVFISEIGGGVEDLYGVITGDKEAPPMQVVVILGINVEPAFQGDFILKVSKNGFTLDGALSIKRIEFLKQVRLEVQWARPIYIALAAKVEAFDIVEGEASIYIGEIETGDEDDPYEFYFEGKAKVEVSIPEKVKLIGGIKLSEINLGVSTKKMWGSIKVGFVSAGVTWKYSGGIEFGQAPDGHNPYLYASLTNVELPKEYWEFYNLEGKDGSMTMIVGDNISIIGSSKSKFQYAVASLDNANQTIPCVLATIDNKIHRFNFQGNEMGLIELEFNGEVPNLIVTDSKGDIYPLVSIDDDPINGNYRVQIIPADKSDSGKEEKYAYIAVKNPGNGEWVVKSDAAVDSTLMAVEIPPELESVSMERVNNDKLNIKWEANHADKALVSLFLIKEDEIESAGYAIASNLQGNSGNTGVQVNIPKGLEEGKYKLRATIQNPEFGYDTILSESSITITDNNKPAKVEGLKAEAYGNGYLKASWTELEDEGNISYFTTVYDSKGNAIENFTDYEVAKNSIVLGGEFKDKVTGKTIKLDTNKEYTIGVTAKKVLKHEGGAETIHIGEEVLSNKILLRTPQPPAINAEYKNEPILIKDEDRTTGKIVSKVYFNSSTVSMDIKLDQDDVNTSVYLDGEYFLNFNKKEFELNFLDLSEGTHKVEFKSENSYKDVSKKTMIFTVDTEAPQLLIDYPKPGFISDNEVVDIKGTAESGSTVTINGIEVPLDSSDVFNYEYKLNENKLKEEIVIRAKDSVGNTTVYSTEVSNGMIKGFRNIYIKSTVEEILSGSETELKVIGVDDTGKEVEIDPKNIHWSLLEGEVLADINEKGILKANEAGDIVLKASYYISEDYSYDDALELKIIDNIEHIYITPNISSMEAGREVNFALNEATKYSETNVDNSIVNWSISSGSGIGQIDKFGHFKALKEGTVIVKGSYTDKFGNYQELSFEIKVVKREDKPEEEDPDNENPDEDNPDEEDPDDSEGSNPGNSSSDTNIDNAIEKIWRDLIERENDIVIESIENIKAEEERSFSIRGMVEVQIPKGALKKNDQMFVGRLNNPEALVNSQEYTLLGDIIELQFKEAQGNLNRPIKVIFKYRASQDINTDNLGVFYYNPRFASWEPIEGTMDAKMGTVTVELNHLSKYAVLEKKKETPKVMPGKGWTIKFSHSLDESTINNESIMLLDSEGNAKAVNLQYNDKEKTIKVIPKENYEEGKTYYICISNKLLSKNKGSLGKEVQYMFQVENYDLKGKEVVYNKDVPADKQWEIKFSQPISEQELSDKIYVVDENGNLVPVTLSLNTNKDTVTIVPKTNYRKGEKYYIIVENLVSIKKEHLREKTWMEFKVIGN